MTKEEQEEVTDDAIEELKDHCEMKAFSACNVPLQAFHNARATMDSFEKEVKTNSSTITTK
jgi:hypothetical protein